LLYNLGEGGLVGRLNIFSVGKIREPETRKTGKGGKIMYTYELYDGLDYTILIETEEPLYHNEVVSLAEYFTEGWDYSGIAQRIEIYESEMKGPKTLVGWVETPGRRFICRACEEVFPHPTDIVATCPTCGHVATMSDLTG